MALSSSSLLSGEFQITNMMYNTIVNEVNNYLNNNHQLANPYLLLPSLNQTLLDISYEGILNDQNMSIRQIGQFSDFNFFFFKMNNIVYEIVTDRNVSNIYRISQY